MICSTVTVQITWIKKCFEREYWTMYFFQILIVLTLYIINYFSESLNVYLNELREGYVSGDIRPLYTSRLLIKFLNGNASIITRDFENCCKQFHERLFVVEEPKVFFFHLFFTNFEYLIFFKIIKSASCSYW